MDATMVDARRARWRDTNCLYVLTASTLKWWLLAILILAMQSPLTFFGAAQLIHNFIENYHIRH